MKTSRWIAIALAATTIVATGMPPMLWAQRAATVEAPAQNSATAPVSRQQGNWMQHHEKINDRAKQGDVDLLFIGDSITDFWQTPASASSRPTGGGGKEVWGKYYGNRKAMNAGISGDRTQHVLWRLDHGNIDGIHPKLAVVMIGTNNAPQDGNSGEEIGEGIKAIVGKLREKLPESKILLLAIFPRSDKPAENEQMKEKIAKANQIAASLADNKTIYFMDIGPRFLDADGNVPTDILPDHLHPNAKGYAIWADAIEPRVAELMGENTAVAPATRAGSWMQRHEKINERAKQGDVDLLFIGDSITDIWQQPAPRGGKEVWEKYYGNRKAMNAGIGGDRTQHVLWRLENGNIDSIKPKLAVVMIGTNNSNGKDNTAEEIADGIKAIVAKLREKLPETKVLLLGVFPRGDMADAKKDVTTAQRAKNAKASELASKVADDKMVFYMDIGQKFLDTDGTLSKDIMPDYLHPNAKGYEIWAEAIEPKVAELLGEKK